MPSSKMLRRVAFVRTDVSEERIASIIRVKTIGELETSVAVTTAVKILNLSWVLVRKRTIPTKRPPFVDEF
jgi:hypothetical protein